MVTVHNLAVGSVPRPPKSNTLGLPEMRKSKGDGRSRLRVPSVFGSTVTALRQSELTEASKSAPFSESTKMVVTVEPNTEGTLNRLLPSPLDFRISGNPNVFDFGGLGTEPTAKLCTVTITRKDTGRSNVVRFNLRPEPGRPWKDSIMLDVDAFAGQAASFGVATYDRILNKCSRQWSGMGFQLRAISEETGKSTVLGETAAGAAA